MDGKIRFGHDGPPCLENEAGQVPPSYAPKAATSSMRPGGKMNDGGWGGVHRGLWGPLMKEQIPSRALKFWGVSALALALLTFEGCGAVVFTFNSNHPLTGAGSISGTMVEGSTNRPVSGAIVLLERPDSAGIDRVLSSATSASDGSFNFGALAAGNYDVVAAASLSSTSGGTVTFAATITFSVPANTRVGEIPLIPENGFSMPNGLPAEIRAMVTTAGAGSALAEAEIKLSALQTATTARGVSIRATIPAFTGSSPDVTTMPGAACPTATACANYTLFVPSSDPVFGTFNPVGTSYTIPSFGPVEVIYSIEGRAFVTGGGGNPDCMPSTLTAGPVVPRGTLPSVLPNLNFTGCQ